MQRNRKNCYKEVDGVCTKNTCNKCGQGLTPRMDDPANSILTFYNYKEPLKKIENGFGYYGTLAVTKDGTGVQCHICGQIHERLDNHVYKIHKMKVSEYKKKFGLAATTALVSEKVRRKSKEVMMEWLASPEGKEHLKRLIESNKNRKKGSTKGYKERLETKNKKGTCPDQLLEKIKEVKEKLGRVPTSTEFQEHTGGQRYQLLIRATFGTWANALGMLGFKPPERTGSDGAGSRYTSDELLEFLNIYAQENRKLPTATDCRRGLLPAESTYKRHFGSLVKARARADVNRFIE